MCKCKKCCKKTLSIIGKVVLFVGILVAFYKLPALLGDKWFSCCVKHRNYQQNLED